MLTQYCRPITDHPLVFMLKSFTWRSIIKGLDVSVISKIQIISRNKRVRTCDAGFVRGNDGDRVARELALGHLAAWLNGVNFQDTLCRQARELWAPGKNCFNLLKNQMQFLTNRSSCWWHFDHRLLNSWFLSRKFIYFSHLLMHGSVKILISPFL